MPPNFLPTTDRASVHARNRLARPGIRLETLARFARRLRLVSIETIRELCERGALPTVQVGRVTLVVTRMGRSEFPVILPFGPSQRRPERDKIATGVSAVSAKTSGWHRRFSRSSAARGHHTPGRAARNLLRRSRPEMILQPVRLADKARPATLREQPIPVIGRTGGVA